MAISPIPLAPKHGGNVTPPSDAWLLTNNKEWLLTNGSAWELVGTVSLNVAEPSYSTPVDNPALPSWVDNWQTSFQGSTGGSAPMIGRITSQAGRNNAVAIAGDAVDSGTSVNFFGMNGSGSKNTTGTILERTGNFIAAALPNSLPANSAYVTWLSNSNGTGNPVIVNKTEAWWIQGSSTATTSCFTGDTVSVFGQNLSNSGQCAIYIDTVGYQTATSVNPYRVQFTLPSLSAGSYDVWLHNGHGGKYGWSKCPIQLVATSAASYGIDYGSHSVNMPAPTGTDDLANFNTAKGTINGTGGSGTINFQAGTYKFSGPINLFSNANKAIWIKGAGSGSTTIVPTAGFTPDGNNWFMTGSDRCKISDLTMDVSGGLSTCTKVISMNGYFANFILNAPLNIISLYFNGPGLLSSCTVTGTGFISQSVTSSMLIDSSRFNAMYETECPLRFTGTSNVSISGCDVYDETPGAALGNHTGVGRLALFTPVGNIHNTYVGGSTSHALVPYGGKAEQILYDNGSAGSKNHNIASATNTGGVTVITLASDAAYDYTLYPLFITGGKGTGQYGLITSVSGRAMTLDRQLNLLPDSSSQCDVSDQCIRCAAYGNTQSGNLAAVQAATGSATGVNIYGGSDCFYDGNTVSNLDTIAEIFAPQVGGGPAMAPAMFNLVQNNTGTGICTQAIYAQTCLLGSAPESQIGVGNMFRNVTGTAVNPIAGTAVGNDRCASIMHGSGHATAGCECLIIDTCTFSGFDKGIGTINASVGNTDTLTVITNDSSFALGTGTFAGSKAKIGELSYSDNGTSYTGYAS